MRFIEKYPKPHTSAKILELMENHLKEIQKEEDNNA